MPINTNLSVSPYFDDFDQNSEYYKILFKPAVAVQTRELNQLQSILQNQIERFGNNIYKRGTIVDGCNFMFYENYPYIKLNDSETDGTPTNPQAYLNLFVKNPTNGLAAYVLDYKEGYEATDPDLKTIYIKYINSGLTGNSTAFSPGDTLVVYDANNTLSKVIINNGSSGWSNTDSVVVVSAILVNSTASFTNGEVITQSTTGSTAVINGIDTTTVSGKTILRLKPVQSDLINTAVPLTKWVFSPNFSVVGNSSSTSAVVEENIGSGAEGYITTDSINGSIENITFSSGGSGYYIQPYITIRQNYFNTGDYNNLLITAYNYKSQIRVSSLSGTVGNGYAFGVTNGIIYKNGYFLKVDPQTVIVSKYSSSPTDISVGFDVAEELVNHNVDSSLLDNATGTPNEMAPGADRLKLTPVLVAVNSAAASTNTEFLSIVEFKEGYPYKQNRTTQYSGINDEMAKRTRESAGDFAQDRFQVTTRSPLSFSNEANAISVIIDPGTAYVSGYRVETKANYAVDVEKGVDFLPNDSASLNIAYGNYVDINEVGGTFAFHTGDSVDLYNTTKRFVSNSSLIVAGNTNPVGTKIGTANMRQLLHVSGTPGTNNALYRLYLFNIKMNQGANFSDVRSVYYNGTKKGIADTVVVFYPATNSSITKLISGVNGKSKLLFPTAANASLSAANLSYNYKSANLTLSMPNSAIMSISAPAGDLFPYGNNATLTFDDKNDIIITPVDSHLIIKPTLTGTVSVNSTSSNIVGSATVFADPYLGLFSGDYVYVYSNSTAYDIKRVVSVSNNSQITVDSPVSFVNSSATISRVFPQNIPIPLSSGFTRDNYVVNVNSSGSTLNIDLNVDFTAAGTSNVSASYIVSRSAVSPDAKSASRNLTVKLNLANNSAGSIGPWCLGVPDIFRLRGVYLSSSSSVTTNDIDITDQFYIDHNQNPDFYDLGFLYKKSNSNFPLSTSNWLLVVFDAFTTSGSLHTVSSYVSSTLATRKTTDSTALSSLTTSVNTMEVPEVFTADGTYYDLIDQIDFRPAVVNSVALVTNSTNAPINPEYSVSFGSYTNDKKFPIPGSGLSYSHKYFLGRQDLVSVNKDNNFTVTKGKPASSKPPVPTLPVNSMPIDLLNITPYPTLPYRRSSSLAEILDTGIANERFSYRRSSTYTVTSNYNSFNISKLQPIGYDMESIGNLERRIKALEYYVSLSLLESSVKDLTIPSAIDPSINRFKFGFFTDNFETTQFAELLNPEYNASVSNNKLTPKELTTIINPVLPNTSYTCEFLLVDQKTATVTQTISNTNPTIYRGVLVKIDPKYIQIQRHSKNHKHTHEEWHGQKVEVELKSLKPLTNHTVFIDDPNYTFANSIIVYGNQYLPNSTSVGVLSTTVQTDTQGRAKFKFHLNIDESVYLPMITSEGGKHKKGVVHDPGVKRVVMYNSDKTSTATFNLPPIRFYSKDSSPNYKRTSGGGGGSDRSPGIGGETWGGAAGTDSSRVGFTDSSGRTTFSDGKDYNGN